MKYTLTALNFTSLVWNRFSQLLHFFVLLQFPNQDLFPSFTRSLLSTVGSWWSACPVWDCWELRTRYIVHLCFELCITDKNSTNNLNDFCSKDTSNACCTPGNVACESKRFINCIYLFTLFLCSYFSTVNTDSETAVVNVTYGTREQARQWVNFALLYHQMQLQKYWFCQRGFLCLPLFGQTDSLLKLTPRRSAGLFWILNDL